MRSKGVFAGVLALGLAVTATAQERWRVRCVDDAGKPVAGAEIHVWQARRLPDGTGQQVQGGPFTSDENGFADTVVPLTYDGDKFSRWVYARVPGKLVGTLRSGRFFKDEPVPDPVVTLSPSRSVRGRITTPDGFSPASVKVRVASLSELGDGFVPKAYYPRTRSIAGLGDTLPERFDRQVAADGTFEFHDFPMRPFVVFITEAKGLAHQQWSTVRMEDREMPEVVEMALAKETVFAGRVLGPNGEAVADADVMLQFVDERAIYTWHCRMQTDAQGLFRLDGLPAGKHALVINSRAGLFRPIRLALDGPAPPEPVALRLEAGVEIRGIVKDTQGKPLEGVGLSAVTDSNGGDDLGYIRSDPQGRFAMRLPSGSIHLYVSLLPPDFDRESSETALDLEVEVDDPSLQQLEFVLQRRE